MSHSPELTMTCVSRALFKNSVQFVSFDVMSFLFTSGLAAAPQPLARPRVERAFPRLELCLHGSDLATLEHLSLRRHDTLVGVFSSALNGSELVSACNQLSQLADVKGLVDILREL